MDYIFETTTNKKKPKFVSFTLTLNPKRINNLQDLKPQKVYIGNQHHQAFYKMGLDQLQELPKNNYKNSSINPQVLINLMNGHSKSLYDPEPYPSSKSNKTLRKLLKDLDNILDNRSENSSFSSSEQSGSNPSFLIGLAE